MELLNSEELNLIHGGASSKCSGSGDTIICIPGVGDVVCCATVETTCGSSFSSKCNVLKVTIDCTEFTVKPIAT